MADRQYPVRGLVYSAKQIETDLKLDDSAHYMFLLDKRRGVIQNSHLSVADLLSVPGMADTRWRYLRTTNEWIPLFEYAGEHDALRAVLDLEHGKDFITGKDDGHWWATPKGFPRSQEVINI